MKLVDVWMRNVRVNLLRACHAFSEGDVLARPVPSGMTIPLRPAAKTFDVLAAGLAEAGQAKKVGNTGRAFVLVHVECVGEGSRMG